MISSLKSTPCGYWAYCSFGFRVVVVALLVLFVCLFVYGKGRVREGCF